MFNLLYSSFFVLYFLKKEHKVIKTDDLCVFLLVKFSFLKKTNYNRKREEQCLIWCSLFWCTL